MNLSEPFIRRPVGTTLLTIAITLAGFVAYFKLPVSPLPHIDLPTIAISASLPGASPETMASAVATPLERSLSRIAGVTEMTSSSTLGATSIILQFEQGRDVDAAGREVQAAINAARAHLPANLPSNPYYRKVNPSDSPIMLLTMVSDYYSKAEMFGYASNIIVQKLSQLPGVGQVLPVGSSNPAVRVEINPTIINQLNLGLEEIRAAISSANALRPKGSIDVGPIQWTINTTDQLTNAEQFQNLIIAHRDGAVVRLGDVARVSDSVEDIRNFAITDGRPSISVLVFRQPGANIISTVDSIKTLVPTLAAQLPAEISLSLGSDRSASIRASLAEVQHALLLSVILVILVVYLFLRDWRATIVPTVAVPVSLIGTFGVMYLLGYSIDNLSLMALTICTGFVVDDAIVVTEYISRYMEEGMDPLSAAIRGAREIGFTVLSITLSLIAVFIPILLMRGMVGLIMREFAVTLSIAILISLVISLTTTPMLCAILIKKSRTSNEAPSVNWLERIYGYLLRVVLRFPGWTIVGLIAIVAFNIYLYVKVPKGFFPQQDASRLIGSIQADQGTSYQAMVDYVKRFSHAIGEDPNVERVLVSTGSDRGSGTNTARVFATLAPKRERKYTADEIIAGIRKRTSSISGANCILQPVQELRMGGRSSAAQYQYTLRGSDLQELNAWTMKLMAALRKLPELADVNTDQQDRGKLSRLNLNRDMIAMMGLDMTTIDNTLYDAFGQRQVSTIYRPDTQHRVVMVLENEFAEGPESLKTIYVRSRNNVQVSLQELYTAETRNTALSVAHSGLFPSSTISFNVAPGIALSEVVPLINSVSAEIGMPTTIRGDFQGTAQAFQVSLSNQPVLILAAILAVYIVLGILYESLIHPLTILSTLPSAGVGAILALILCRIELNVIGLIGILLLIGIVKKNAIMMIDYAIVVQRRDYLTAQQAIYDACMHRLRPIMMTTMAAILGGIPLAIGRGEGSEMRTPLGISIVGGLLVSQLVTLFTTPVVYLYLDRLSNWWRRKSES